ncbi:MAG: hypothetical protein AB7G12_17160 [Thermoanaerobaculia bacterium]
MKRRFAIVALAGLFALPLASAAVEKTVPFALDQWIEIKATDGPVTLHRIRLASQGGLTKSKLFRPGSSSYTRDVQVQLEFSNEATSDWDARIRFEWIDAAGAVIDGYAGTESLDSESKFEQQTMTLSTLRYGLEKAKKIRFEITVTPD